MLARGRRGGAPAEAVVELIDRYDEATGFTAMERTTGWDGSIKAILNARGVTPRGAHPAEIAVPGPLYAEELRRRGFSLTETRRSGGPEPTGGGIGDRRSRRSARLEPTALGAPRRSSPQWACSTDGRDAPRGMAPEADGLRDVVAGRENIHRGGVDRRYQGGSQRVRP